MHLGLQAGLRSWLIYQKLFAFYKVLGITETGTRFAVHDDMAFPLLWLSQLHGVPAVD
jgi:hypothetical protein